MSICVYVHMNYISAQRSCCSHLKMLIQSVHVKSYFSKFNLYCFQVENVLQYKTENENKTKTTHQQKLILLLMTGM